MVLNGELPAGLQTAAEMYAGCVSGAIQQEKYLNIIKKVGFENVQVQKKKLISLPDDLLANYLNPEELKAYQTSGTGIYSITVYAEKPNATCCDPGAGCC